jgi:hypothetical protein
MQLSLFSTQPNGDMVLTRDEKFVKPDISEKYNKMISELDEYQRKVVGAAPTDSLSCTAGAGCLTGDTEIRINRAGKSQKISLEKLYRKFNRLRSYRDQSWDLNIPTKIRSFCGDVIRLEKIVAVFKSGVKKVFRVTLQNGFEIKATADHKFLTKRGWVAAGFLKKSDEVMIDTLSKHKKTSSGQPPIKKYYKYTPVGFYYPNKVRNLKRGKLTYRSPEHRLVVEADMNGISVDEFIRRTFSPNKLKVLDKRYCVHHIDGNPLNNILENLQIMPYLEHNQLHASGYAGFKHGLPEYSNFKSIQYLGEEETYDIECETHHNFAANNIIVHNSGKTKTIIARAIKLVYEDKIDPEKIVLITFTNKAANEMKERYISFFQDQYPEGTSFPTPHISTIHSFCLSQIRRSFGFPRTILTEYQSYKLWKECLTEPYMKRVGIPLTKEVAGKTYKVFQNMQSNMEILYSGVPLFTETGKFEKVVSWKEFKETHPAYPFIRKMPHTKLMKIITGQKDLRLNIFEVLDKYLFTTGLDPETWQEAVNKYLTEKYSNNVLDFGDMDFQFLMLITQHKKLRDKLHSRIEHIIQDECQDASCNQFLTCILSDKESYEDFERK